MKVLKPGKDYGWSLETVCTGIGNERWGCGAILLVEIEDLRYYKGVSGTDIGSKPPAVCFKCPQCSTVTDIDQKDWPRGINILTLWTKEWHTEDKAKHWHNGDKE